MPIAFALSTVTSVILSDRYGALRFTEPSSDTKGGSVTLVAPSL